MKLVTDVINFAIILTDENHETLYLIWFLIVTVISTDIQTLEIRVLPCGNYSPDAWLHGRQKQRVFCVNPSHHKCDSL